MVSPTAVTLGVVVDFTMVNAGPWIAGTVMVLETTGAIGVPLGGVPTAEAVFITEPASRSTWVIRWVPVQVVEAPGNSVVAGQVIPLAVGSLTETAVMVTLPVFVTLNVYVTMLPTAVKLAVGEALTMVKLGAAVTGTVTVFEVTGVMGVPLGGVPTTEATLLTVPESRSAWVTVCEAEQVVDAPVASITVTTTVVKPLLKTKEVTSVTVVLLIEVAEPIRIPIVPPVAPKASAEIVTGSQPVPETVNGTNAVQSPGSVFTEIWVGTEQVKGILQLLEQKFAQGIESGKAAPPK